MLLGIQEILDGSLLTKTVYLFLKKVHSLLNEGGYLAIIVPPRKPFIVGGHVTIWNAGLVLYNLILASLF